MIQSGANRHVNTPEAVEVALAAPSRPLLLPRLLTLAVIGGVSCLLARWPAAVAFGFMFSLFYFAVVLLRTRDLVRATGSLHRWDRLICQASGPLALLIFLVLATSYLTIICLSHGNSRIDPTSTDPWNFSLRMLLQFSLETGVVLSTACLFTARSFGHVRPLLLWKILCGFLLVMFSPWMLVLLMLPFIPSKW
jgi:hypothetical protein